MIGAEPDDVRPDRPPVAADRHEVVVLQTACALAAGIAAVRIAPLEVARKRRRDRDPTHAVVGRRCIVAPGWRQPTSCTAPRARRRRGAPASPIARPSPAHARRHVLEHPPLQVCRCPTRGLAGPRRDRRQATEGPRHLDRLPHSLGAHGRVRNRCCPSLVEHRDDRQLARLEPPLRSHNCAPLVPQPLGRVCAELVARCSAVGRLVSPIGGVEHTFAHARGGRAQPEA